MTRLCYRILTWVFVLFVFAATRALAQPANLRITEVDPTGDQAEVKNVGGAFNNAAIRFFCHRFNYISVVGPQNFNANEVKVFGVTGLNNTDADLWLYRNSGFALSSSIIHGVKYGPQPNVGRTGVAVNKGIWPSTTSFAPAPLAGTTLAWDGFGVDPKDWYIDATPSMGVDDPATVPGTVAAGLAFPTGTQDFEGMQLGDQVVAITDWVVVNTSTTPGIFTVRAVNDVNGSKTARGSSTQWLRIRDQEAADEQNLFYSNTITSPDDRSYVWTFFVNLEQTPPVGKRPSITIQHVDGAFTNAWGIRLNPSAVALFVAVAGGPPAGTTLYSIGGNMGIGDWVKIELAVDFTNNEVSACANDGTAVTLPINPGASFDKTQFRICYRGEGNGNVMTLLLDDVSVLDPDVPVFFNSLAAEALDNSVRLVWDVYADEPIAGFRVYRRQGSAGLSAINSRLLDPSAREFVDRGLEFGATYQYVVGAVKPDGTEIRSLGTTGSTPALRLTLAQNAPNPFKPATVIEYTLPTATSVTLSVYDVQGKHVVTLDRGGRAQGTHVARWDGRDTDGRLVSGGIYFYKLQAGKQVLTRKMVLLR